MDRVSGDARAKNFPNGRPQQPRPGDPVPSRHASSSLRMQQAVQSAVRVVDPGQHAGSASREDPREGDPEAERTRKQIKDERQPEQDAAGDGLMSPSSEFIRRAPRAGADPLRARRRQDMRLRLRDRSP